MDDVKYIVKLILSAVISGFYYSFRVFPIQNNKIVIDNFSGKGFGDNGKYIALELLKRGKCYDIVWMTKDEKEKFPEGIRRVPYADVRKMSLRSIYEQVTARVWIDNTRKELGVRKRRGQYYIMTWHGGIGPKKIDEEVENQLEKDYVKRAKNDSKMADLLIAESGFTYHKWHTKMWYDGEILKCGTPRQDIFFNPPKELRKNILAGMGLDVNCHILLYAPTFRNKMEKKNLSIYRLPWREILQVCEAKFGGEWVGFIRLHPIVAHLDKANGLAEEGVYDVTHYPDMQELLSVSDVVLTDYSSSIYDFGLTGRPGFILAGDMDEYMKQRDVGFGDYGMEVIPFPIAKSTEELCRLIQDFDGQAYEKRLHGFYHDFCGLYSGGHAAEILADRIDEVIRQGDA